MKWNVFIAVAMIIVLFGAYISFLLAFFLGFSDSWQETNAGLALFGIIPGVALLILVSVFVFGELDEISNWQLVAIVITGTLSTAELLFIMRITGTMTF
jgi:hypothetical protein